MASFGTIITHVYTSSAQIPIPGATVAVTRKLDDGRYVLLALRISDESGKTAAIRIPTPDLSEGLAPGGPVPFALVDLWVESPGFELIRIEDMQVFPDTETIQDLELIPLPENTAPSSRSETVEIPPQDL